MWIELSDELTHSAGDDIVNSFVFVAQVSHFLVAAPTAARGPFLPTASGLREIAQPEKLVSGS